MAQGTVVGRIKENVMVAGRECWTLFDTGSMNNYVVEDVASLGVVVPMPEVLTTRLGGSVRRIEKKCEIFCMVQDRFVDLSAYVLPEIGRDENGKRIEILFGALEMQRRGMVLDLKAERIDMTHYPREFVEYTEVGP